jgi:hypothetical protein
MTAPLNNHDHKQHEPWRTLGQIRDDLRQARAVLSKFKSPACEFALEHVNRALARIGDGSRSEE